MPSYYDSTKKKPGKAKVKYEKGGKVRYDKGGKAELREIFPYIKSYSLYGWMPAWERRKKDAFTYEELQQKQEKKALEQGKKALEQRIQALEQRKKDSEVKAKEPQKKQSKPFKHPAEWSAKEGGRVRGMGAATRGGNFGRNG